MSDLLKDKSEWMLVGHFGVDAGLCWIGDPCYVIHNEEGLPSTLGKNWGDFCDKLHDMNHGAKSFNYARGHEGLGVCVTTGFGDGTYPVYARLQEGRVAQLFIDFFGDGMGGEENGTLKFARQLFDGTSKEMRKRGM